MTTIKPASPSLLADQVFEAIREQIMNGAMPAGSRLRVRDLAAQVGTSVMPVREAIGRLEEAGLAERSPHRGAVVRALTLRELRDVYAVRTVLEVEATRLAVGRLTEGGLGEMEAARDALVRAVDRADPVAAIDGDERLLRALYGFADNPVLLETVEGLWRRCRAYKVVGARRALAEDDRSLWSFPAELVEAARRGDADAAVGVAVASLAAAAARIEVTLV